jgi:nicotinamide-nucleotide amidase
LTPGVHPSSPPSAAIVSVGDELLLGETVDTNGSWLSRELSRLGLRVLRRWVVGDVPDGIRQAVNRALEVAEVVLVTGGLGPTPDDLTREAVAGLLGYALDLDPDLLEGLKARFRARGYGELPEDARAMAEVPRGSTVLPNPHGAAPGLVMENREGNLCILLPGVPREMRGIFGQGVAALLRERYPTRLGSAVRRVTQTRYRYEAKSGDLAEAVGTALLRNGSTLAVAESCTGGLISKRLTDLPGSSRYFLGGVVAYADDVKARVLGVEEELIRHDGVVGEAVAKAMATGVAEGLKASVGVGVTGIAGPGGGSPEKPVGTVWCAVSLGGRTVARKELFLGDREAVRERAAHAALGLLLRLLEGREG